MRITAVKALAVKIPHEDSFGGEGRPDASDGSWYFKQPGWRGLYSDQIETTLVVVETDEGLTGIGEGQSPIGPEVTATVIERVLQPILLGSDPRQVEVLRREMYNAMNLRGHYTGYMVHAISAVDIALWDIRGKALGSRVADLLGGSFRSDIPVYVSGIRGKTLEEKAATAREFAGEGFRVLKSFLGFGVREDLNHVEAFLEATGGEAQVMVDVLWNYNVHEAIHLGRSLERLGTVWLEAPTAPEDIKGHAEIARALDLPIAAGETETTRYQFLQWFESRGLDIAQPDVARCGISESKKIADLAETFNLPVALHSGIMLAPGLAASLQVAAAIPNLLYQEYQPVLLETANRFLKTPIVCEQGKFAALRGPGLGIEFEPESVESYVVNRPRKATISV